PKRAGPPGSAPATPRHTRALGRFIRPRTVAAAPAALALPIPLSTSASPGAASTRSQGVGGAPAAPTPAATASNSRWVGTRRSVIPGSDGTVWRLMRSPCARRSSAPHPVIGALPPIDSQRGQPDRARGVVMARQQKARREAAAIKVIGVVVLAGAAG